MNPALDALRKIEAELAKIVASRGAVTAIRRDWILKTAQDGIRRAEEEAKKK